MRRAQLSACLCSQAYGMFVWNAQTRNFWFNHLSLDSEQDFMLTGMVLGLAIYNSVLLDAHFPLVVYKKLLGKQPDFQAGPPSQKILRCSAANMHTCLAQPWGWQGALLCCLLRSCRTTMRLPPSYLHVAHARRAAAGAVQAASLTSSARAAAAIPQKSTRVQDLLNAMPEVGRSMQQLLEFEGDVAATFSLSFDVDWDYFGELRTSELKPGGSQASSGFLCSASSFCQQISVSICARSCSCAPSLCCSVQLAASVRWLLPRSDHRPGLPQQPALAGWYQLTAAHALQIPVTAENRQEYVDLYTQWLLTKSIQSQFNAFHRGFHNVRLGPPPPPGELLLVPHGRGQAEDC